jgi:hypothetical protein
VRVGALYFLISFYLAIAMVAVALGYTEYPVWRIASNEILASNWEYRLPEAFVGFDQIESDSSALDLDGINARPLFAQTRKPFVLKQQDVIVEPIIPKTAVALPEVTTSTLPELPVVRQVDPASFRLMGTSQIITELRALIADADHPDGKWFSLGEEVSSWNISEIKTHEVVLVHQGRYFTLKQFVENIIEPLVPGSQNQ